MKKMAIGDSGRAATTATLTVVALVAFAGNSILCRLALGAAAIDPASYTAVRLCSGALTLWAITSFRAKERSSADSRLSWIAGGLLFLYAIAFAYAYRSLTAGTGALILFAAVQLTMLVLALRSGERPSAVEWCGWLMAMVGLGYLLLPAVAAPPLTGSLLMMAAGIAWGAYSILGRGVADPVQATTDNFLRSVPLVLLFALTQLGPLSLSPSGFAWAVLSGAVTSGLGYIIWYAALARLSAAFAATVQLAVPAIAAFGGVVFLSEQVTPRLLIAAAAILGGIGLSLAGRHVRAVESGGPLVPLARLIKMR